MRVDVCACSSQVAALLEAMTRDGRLHPGLAAEVHGPIVSSEVSEKGTSDQKFRMTPPHIFAEMVAAEDAKLGLPPGTAAQSLLAAGGNAVRTAGRSVEQHR